ncbi:MAG: hypothetical protein H6740_14235 [Alphaproteobacteria bacterium]|nr:hypothetical protein [Alphaproteobacteria bacterium]
MKAALADWRTAPVSEPVRAALRFLTVFVPPEADFGAEDIQRLREAGIDDQGIRDLMYASFTFQNLSRWADAMDWPVHDAQALEAAGSMLWKLGYKVVSVPPDVAWRGESLDEV